jgi:hypothetical protein
VRATYSRLSRVNFQFKLNAMGYQKGLDPVQMAGTLTHQLLSFAMKAPRIPLLGRWRANHAAALRVALYEAYNRPKQTPDVDIVGLDVLGAAIDRETRCIKDVVLDTWLTSTLCNQNPS